MTNLIQLNHIGIVGLNGAEISDFDPQSQRLFVTGESEGKPVLQVVDASDPTQPIQINEIDLSSLGSGIQSVAVRKGTGSENSIVAVAISANTSTDTGKVVFFDAVTLAKISEVTVGALPDMITFTPDGSKLLVANEGEPNEDYSVDPEGSISIIDVDGAINVIDVNNDQTNFATFTGTTFTVKLIAEQNPGLDSPQDVLDLFGNVRDTNQFILQDAADPSKTVTIFEGPDGSGKTVDVTIDSSGNLAIDGVQVSTGFSQQFHFGLINNLPNGDPTGNGADSYTFSTNNLLNPDSSSQFVTYSKNQDVLVFGAEELPFAQSNKDFDDMIVEIHGIQPLSTTSQSTVSFDSGKLQKVFNDQNITTAYFTSFNNQKQDLIDQGVRLFGLNATVAQDLEPEYIAVSSDSQTAFITLQENNAVAVLDIASGTINDIVPLGFKDHSLDGNGLDASDRDDGINIKNWPILGMYQPDGISSFQVGGLTYYITANEGDARIRPTDDDILPAPNDGEGDIFNEEARVKDVILDPTAFPNAAELQSDENIGRLNITTTLGDTDGDGDFDQLYAYGGRSFSIWNDQGELVYDSGDQIEQILAQKTPTLFNANEANPEDVDTRSDNKGPEPESVVVGVIDDVPYGFVGLERAGGGVMVYNLSDPTAPEFIQYITTESDIAPEGLKFISAEDSPNHQPMLAVSNEVSNTVSFYEINPAPQLTNYEFTNLPKLGTTTTGQDIFLGGFSGLYFQGVAANGNLKFVTHTDRGPNGEPTGQNRPFLLPDFQPEIVSFELNQTTDEITITKRTGLFSEDGTTPLTGLPNLQAGEGGTAYTDEIGVDLNGQVLPNDTLGADLEGIVIAPNGDYWMVDEYRPAIYHFDVNGKLLDRFIPQGTATATDPDQPAGTFGNEVLPAVYAQRRANRGFEAVALEGNTLYAFIQSPIDNPDSSGDTTSRNSRNLRILEFDIVSQTVTGEYLYLLDDVTGTGNAKTDKIGDAVSLGNGKFAVVERDDRGDETSNKLIYQIDLATATNINNPANFTLPADKTIEQLTEAELTAAGITSVSKNLIVNAAEIGYTGVEKLEGLALVSPNTLALMNDNDFNVGGTTTPEKLGIIELPYNLVEVPEVVFGGPSSDTLIAGVSVNGVVNFDGVQDIVFTGAGNDEVDVPFGGSQAGDNRIFTGSGIDIIDVGDRDRAFGGSSNDEIDATDATDYRLSGGTGNDIFYLGADGRAVGGDGDDQFYVQEGGGNLLSGGAGADQFWILTGDLPSAANTILDFEKGTDVLGIAGQGVGFDFTDLTLSGNSIAVGSTTIAILNGIDTTSLTATNFAFM